MKTTISTASSHVTCLSRRYPSCTLSNTSNRMTSTQQQGNGSKLRQFIHQFTSSKQNRTTTTTTTTNSITKKGVHPQRRGLSTTASASDTENEGQDASTKYKIPPDDISVFVTRPDAPSISLSPSRTRVLYSHKPKDNPPVAELARKELKLGGIRIDTKQNSGSRMGHTVKLSIGKFPKTEADIGVYEDITGVPENGLINFVSWSPNGKKLAFTVRFHGDENEDEDEDESSSSAATGRKPLELWIADVETKSAAKVTSLAENYQLNTIFESYSWLNDDELLCCVIPKDRSKKAPRRPKTPLGPRIESNVAGNVRQARTYADLLKNDTDEKLFEYYCESQLVKTNIKTNETTMWCNGEKKIFTRVEPSPCGEYVILECLKRPFSYAVPCGRFPKKVWVAEAATDKVVREICDLPLAENIPIVSNSTRVGPRGVNWRPDKEATLYWTECQDEGDPRNEVGEGNPRDISYLVDFTKPTASTDAPKAFYKSGLRLSGYAWGCDDLSIAYENWYKTRTSRVAPFSPKENTEKGSYASTPISDEEKKNVLWERNYEDSYGEPGGFVTRRTNFGTYVLARVEGETPLGEGTATGKTGAKLLLQGSGANPKGNRPFFDIFDVDTRKAKRLWRSPKKEKLFTCGGLLSDYGENGEEPITLQTMRILTTKQSPSEYVQYYESTFDYKRSENSKYALNIDKGDLNIVEEFEKERVEGPCVLPVKEMRISNFPHPHPQLSDPPKEIIKYKRDDGVELSGTLYTPPGYDAKRDGPLPLLIWAYPREFKNAESASQLRESPFRFTGISPQSSLVWLARGYAVLDGPALPIIAQGDDDDAEPNDTYVQQLVAGAKAAVDEVVRRGVADKDRVAVGGHSYGAFMAANLLAHAPDLFCCAVARSGAYNRTLTPFGFQAEERSFWEAPDVYSKMSPFNNAHLVKKPILLIHGEDDPNSGTNVMQSERFFAALKGNGAQAKLVVLPHENHGYRGLESVLHVMAETSEWLDEHCKKEETN